MAKKSFDIPKYREFQIQNGGRKFGKLRLKANKILWRPKGKHKEWYSIELEDFVTIIEKKGHLQRH